MGLDSLKPASPLQPRNPLNRNQQVQSALADSPLIQPPLSRSGLPVLTRTTSSLTGSQLPIVVGGDSDQKAQLWRAWHHGIQIEKKPGFDPAHRRFTFLGRRKPPAIHIVESFAKGGYHAYDLKDVVALYDGHRDIIVIESDPLRTMGFEELIQTLSHELAHAIQRERSGGPIWGNTEESLKQGDKYLAEKLSRPVPKVSDDPIKGDAIHPRRRNLPLRGLPPGGTRSIRNLLQRTGRTRFEGLDIKQFLSILVSSAVSKLGIPDWEKLRIPLYVPSGWSVGSTPYDRGAQLTAEGAILSPHAASMRSSARETVMLTLPQALLFNVFEQSGSPERVVHGIFNSNRPYIGDVGYFDSSRNWIPLNSQKQQSILNKLKGVDLQGLADDQINALEDSANRRSDYTSLINKLAGIPQFSPAARSMLRAFGTSREVALSKLSFKGTELHQTILISPATRREASLLEKLTFQGGSTYERREGPHILAVFHNGQVMAWEFASLPEARSYLWNNKKLLGQLIDPINGTSPRNGTANDIKFLQPRGALPEIDVNRFMNTLLFKRIRREANDAIQSDRERAAEKWLAGIRYGLDAAEILTMGGSRLVSWPLELVSRGFDMYDAFDTIKRIVEATTPEARQQAWMSLVMQGFGHVAGDVAPRVGVASKRLVSGWRFRPPTRLPDGRVGYPAGPVISRLRGRSGDAPHPPLSATKFSDQEARAFVNEARGDPMTPDERKTAVQDIANLPLASRIGKTIIFRGGEEPTPAEYMKYLGLLTDNKYDHEMYSMKYVKKNGHIFWRIGVCGERSVGNLSVLGKRGRKRNNIVEETFLMHVHPLQGDMPPRRTWCPLGMLPSDSDIKFLQNNPDLHPGGRATILAITPKKVYRVNYNHDTTLTSDLVKSEISWQETLHGPNVTRGYRDRTDVSWEQVYKFPAGAGPLSQDPPAAIEPAAFNPYHHFNKFPSDPTKL